MKTTRRNFLTSIPALAALLRFKPEHPKVEPSAPCDCENAQPIGWRVTTSGTAGEKIVAGQAVFYGPDGKVYASGHHVVGIALQESRRNNRIEILISEMVHYEPTNATYTIL